LYKGVNEEVTQIILTWKALLFILQIEEVVKNY
jgi:hypothetical protein